MAIEAAPFSFRPLRQQQPGTGRVEQRDAGEDFQCPTCGEFHGEAPYEPISSSAPQRRSAPQPAPRPNPPRRPPAAAFRGEPGPVEYAGGWANG